MLNTLFWSLQVLPLAPASAEEALKLAVAEVMASPAAALQALYDHAHGSYSQVLPSGSVMRCIIARQNETGRTISSSLRAGPLVR